MKNESEFMYCINPEYPLTSGDWDIHYQDIASRIIYIQRYRLICETLVKELERIGMNIVHAKRMR